MSKLALQVLPALVAHIEYPDSLNPAFFSLINLVTFLAGAATDLRRAIVSLLDIVSESLGVVESASKAIIHIVSGLPSTGAIPHPSGDFLYSPRHSQAQFDEIREHLRTLLAQPSFVRSLAVFSANTRSTWNGLLGNARVSRAARGAERVWKNTASGYKYKLASLLEALDITAWEIAPVSSDNEEFSYNFSNMRLHFPALLPADFAISYAHGGSGSGAPTSITLKGLYIVINSASYDITKRGLLGFTDSGIASINVPFDIDVDFSVGEVPIVVPRITGKVDVQLQSSSKAAPITLTKVWNAWLSTVVASKISESLEERMSESFQGWLEPLFGPAPALVPATATAATDPVLRVVLPDQPAIASPASVSLSPQASLSRQWSMSFHSPSAAPSPAIQTQQPPLAPVGARAAFLASLRMSSGIDIRPLATGRDVLESLSNPFSGPNSAAGHFGDDDDEGSNAGGLKSRSMSMAMSLTDIAQTDSTNITNIEVSGVRSPAHTDPLIRPARIRRTLLDHDPSLKCSSMTHLMCLIRAHLLAGGFHMRIPLQANLRSMPTIKNSAPPLQRS